MSTLMGVVVRDLLVKGPRDVFITHILEPMYRSMISLSSSSSSYPPLPSSFSSYKQDGGSSASIVSFLVVKNKGNFNGEVLKYAESFISHLTKDKLATYVGEDYIRTMLKMWEDYTKFMKYCCAGSLFPKTGQSSLFSMCFKLFRNTVVVSEKTKSVICSIIDSDAVQCNELFRLVSMVGQIDCLDTVMSLTEFEKKKISGENPIFTEFIARPYCEMITRKLAEKASSVFGLITYSELVFQELDNITRTVRAPVTLPAEKAAIKVLINDAEPKIADMFTRDLASILDHDIQNTEFHNLPLLLELVKHSLPLSDMLGHGVLAWIDNYVSNVLTYESTSGGEQTVNGMEELVLRFSNIERLLKLLCKIVDIKHRAVAILRQGAAPKECGDKFPKHLAVWVDGVLRKRSDDTNKVLDGVSLLFQNLRDRDAFIEHNRKFMAGRLLKNKTVLDYEQYLISKMKSLVGHNAVSALEGMLFDVSNGPILDRAQYDLLVLTAGRWPTWQTLVIKENTLQPMWEQLTLCAAPLLPKKKLMPVWGEGNVDVLFNSAGGTVYTLKMAPIQAAVLLLFNDHETLSVADIVELTGLDKQILLRVLHPFTLIDKTGKKMPILVKAKDGSVGGKTTLGVDEHLVVSATYTSQKKRIEIPMASLEIAPKEEYIDNRGYSIDAVLVRILKTRKELNYNELVGIALEHLVKMGLFTPEPKDIKTRIENLIDREYFERCETDRTLLKYLA